METPKEYHYVYYSYEEYGRGYIGSRTCKCLPEEDVRYFGSFKDKSFKPTQKIILKDDYATREEAYVDEIILQEYYKVVENPHFANRSYQSSTKFYYIAPEEKSKELGYKVYELGVGIHARTKEQMTEDGKKGGSISGKITKELGIGIHALTPGEKAEAGRRGNETQKELGLGFYGITKEQRSENGKKGGKLAGEKTYRLGLGIHAQTKEEKSKAGKVGIRNTLSQRWKCVETGYVSTPGGLTMYQKARNIDTSKRVRIM